MKVIKGIMTAENAEKAVFYFFNKKGQVTETINLNMSEVAYLCNSLGKNLAKARRKVEFWKGFGITMTVGTVIFAKRWCDERRKTEMLEDELEFAKDDDWFEEDVDGGNS